MPEPTYETWAMTIRTGFGVTDEMIPLVINWVKKRAKWYFIITEKKDDEKHFHIAMVMIRPTSKSNLNTNLCDSAFAKNWTEEQRRVQRRGTKIWYSDVWAENYLRKDDDTVIISEVMPSADLWPDEIQAKYPLPDDNRSKRKFEGDPQFIKYETLWHALAAKHPQFEIVSEARISEFFDYIMYGERLINVISDPRRLAWVKKAFYKFLTYEMKSETDLHQADLAETTIRYHDRWNSE